MFNTIVQIALGILYGLYLATFAPTSQRQKAHELLTQQAVVSMLQPEPTQFQTKIPIAEPTTQPAVILEMIDPWLTEPTPAVAESQEDQNAIAIVSKTSKLLLLPSAPLERQQTSKASSRKKTKAPKTKREKTNVIALPSP